MTYLIEFMKPGSEMGKQVKARRLRAAGEFQGRRVSNNMTIQQQRLTRPTCPSCGRVCTPGSTWKGANYCRGLILLSFIKDQPGLTGWELSQASGIPYDDAKRGLNKLRDCDAVTTEREEIEGDRFRYLYSTGDISDRQRFLDAMSHAEALE